MENRYYIELDRSRSRDGRGELYLYVYDYKRNKVTIHYGRSAITKKLHRIKKSHRIVENGLPQAMWNKTKSFGLKLGDIGITHVLVRTDDNESH